MISNVRNYARLFSCFLISPLFHAESHLLAGAKPVGSDPLLLLGGNGDWDSSYATWASVVREVASWRMYYSGKDANGRMRIGLALSRDGFKWVKYERNPILDLGTPGSWDSSLVYCPIVWKEAGSWKMIFTGCSHRTHHFQIGLASSDNGIEWEKSRANPVFDSCNSWTLNSRGNKESEAWGLLHEGHTYYLLYNPVTRRPRQIGLATSEDLISWKELPDPILPSQGFPWEVGYMKYCANAFKYEKYTYILCAVSNIRYTKSRIGIWRTSSLKDARDRQFLGYVVDTSSDWCKKEVDSPFAVVDAIHRRILCYYGGRSKRNEWQEGVVSIGLEALHG